MKTSEYRFLKTPQNADMEVEKTLKKIRKMEGELAFASPAQAAKLASEIVRLKSTIFDK